MIILIVFLATRLTASAALLFLLTYRQVRSNSASLGDDMLTISLPQAYSTPMFNIGVQQNGGSMEGEFFDIGYSMHDRIQRWTNEWAAAFLEDE